MGNRLEKESSPYLLQHAYNPVDWFPWGEEALRAARDQNKPILVSIGYAACHWCHVMEHESFEDQATADLMNQHFINIKIDREERPDLDHIYMDAVQSMTGSGGWPLNVFLTPEGKPFYGGTYYPPRAAFNRPSWKDVLVGVSNAWEGKRDELLQQAENLTLHLQQSNNIGGVPKSGEETVGFHVDQVQLMTAELLKTVDKTEGGFGQAPKFPQTLSIGFLLHLHPSGKYQSGEHPSGAMEQALLSLDKMIRGGIYDQLGGGLARYSTDNEWLVPHFEKMLYDQALFISVLSDAFLITKKDDYRRVIDQTMGFLQREMLSPEGAFYSALDADSEGEEGKFYVWKKGEIEELFPKHPSGVDPSGIYPSGVAAIACDWYGITGEGNWEGVNILTRPFTPQEIALKHNIPQGEILKLLAEIETAMLKRRATRTRPALDDKQILGWNALMNMALSKAFAATGRKEYKDLAIKNMDWMLASFESRDGSFRHTYKDGVASQPGFLDDYAYLVQALIYLQEITGETKYLDKAAGLTGRIEADFSEAGNLLYYYTNNKQQDVVIRKREIYDGAQPSGNAVMVFNLQYLGIVFDRPDWTRKALDMLASMARVVTRYPGSFGYWALELMRAVQGNAEIVVVGPHADSLRTEILSIFIPHKILQSATRENEAYPLLRQKLSPPDTWIYVCRNYNCNKPVTTVEEMLAQI